jgi:protein tyrosine phosphatase (PTP) superfamily phosphohydrolase (DUF442 family)
LGRSLLWLFILALAGCFSPSRVFAGEEACAIRRFHQVSEGFFRGGQPSQPELQCLKKQGFKTVINLRSQNAEQAFVEGLGMKYVHLPLSVWRQIPGDAIEAFFQVMHDPKNYPVYIHCERGADRTGFMVAAYRVAFDNWEAQRAYDEAMELGMRWWYPSLKRQLYAFAEKRAAYLAPAMQK